MDVSYALFQLRGWTEADALRRGEAAENFRGVAARAWVDYLVAKHFNETVQVIDWTRKPERRAMVACPYAPDRLARFAWVLRASEVCEKVLLPHGAVPADRHRDLSWHRRLREAVEAACGVPAGFHDNPKTVRGYTAQEAQIFDGQLDTVAPAEWVYRNPHERMAYMLAGGAQALGIEGAIARRKAPVRSVPIGL